VDQVAAAFEPWGIDHDDAVTVAAMADATMARCVLDLCRAATPNPHTRWRPSRTAVPGLVLDAPADPFGPEPLSLEVAHLLGAEIAHLSGLGHWWALQDPARAVAQLTAFWSSVHRPDPRPAAPAALAAGHLRRQAPGGDPGGGGSPAAGDGAGGTRTSPAA
jgi:hypothetical protein